LKVSEDYHSCAKRHAARRRITLQRLVEKAIGEYTSSMRDPIPLSAEELRIVLIAFDLACSEHPERDMGMPEVYEYVWMYVSEFSVEDRALFLSALDRYSLDGLSQIHEMEHAMDARS